MGLTVCIAMLAALTAGNDHSPHTRLDVLTMVWGTTLGLALTHWFALSFSVRLVPDPRFTSSPWQLLGPQIALAVLVAVAASIVVLPATTGGTAPKAKSSTMAGTTASARMPRELRPGTVRRSRLGASTTRTSGRLTFWFSASHVPFTNTRGVAHASRC